MSPPAGTFLAKVNSGAIIFPAPLRDWCKASGWDLFRVIPIDKDHLELESVVADADPVDDNCCSLDPDGHLWIPAELRASVTLSEQHVMLRVEGQSIGVSLRKVFDTLGFRP